MLSRKETLKLKHSLLHSFRIVSFLCNKHRDSSKLQTLKVS